MSAEAFFDTNILIYAALKNDARSVRAEELLTVGGVVSVQGLNEFVSVARRKVRMPWKEVRMALEWIQVFCPRPAPVTITTHERAVGIAEQYGYGIYDALIVASALEARCAVLYSEDLQDGQEIRGLVIRNPFWPLPRIG